METDDFWLWLSAEWLRLIDWPPLKPGGRTPPPLIPAEGPGPPPLAMHWLCFHMALLARRADLSTYDSALIINVYGYHYSPNKETESKRHRRRAETPRE